MSGNMRNSMPSNDSGNRTARLRLLIVPFCALLAVVPLLWHGNSCGNDFNFHLLSWMEVHATWHTGNFYPHWAMQPNSGAGEPRFIFYPPISWMLGAALGSLLGGSARGWSATPGAFVFLVLTLAGFSMLALLRRITTARAALFTACLYIANPYTLFVIYERSDFAELMAAIWMPLLFLFALQQCIRIVPLAFLVAALWLTHDASAVMGCYALALLVLMSTIVEYRQQRNLQLSVQRIGRATAGVALGIGLAAFYIVPAAYEQRWVQIEQAIAGDMNPVANFLFRHTTDALHDHVLFMVSWIAVGLLCLGAVLCLVLWRQGKLQKKSLPVLMPVVVLFPVIGFLLLPVSWPLWRYVPELIYLQFPWRLLVPLTVVVSILLGVAITGINARFLSARFHSLWRTAPLFVAASVALCYPSFHQFCDFQDVVPAQFAAFHTAQGRTGYAGTDEYTPLATVSENLPDVMRAASIVQLIHAYDPNDTPPPLPAGASVTVEVWHNDHRRIAVTIPPEMAAKNPQAALLRMLDYPAWRIRVNGHLLQLHLHTVDGRLYIPLPPGNSVITIDHVTTADVWVGRGISILSLLVVFVLLGWRKFRRMSSV
ncbi:MAG TPA: 6-pyruvoyl-tetrahydropterin synthase-related protein [Acidobacteriaceae bacterium]|jgi:uncharacterized membrane protein|nr:6-pyruvoyl-tetrahydropterin synthase-related protein [Acidobacteriaceae bacterium]